MRPFGIVVNKTVSVGEAAVLKDLYKAGSDTLQT
jgi:hypothetical protein